MSRFKVWLWLVVVGLAGAAIGEWHLLTVASCAYFGGMALFIHWAWED